jgi:hypothetical protein
MQTTLATIGAAMNTEDRSSSFSVNVMRRRIGFFGNLHLLYNAQNEVIEGERERKKRCV